VLILVLFTVIPDHQFVLGVSGGLAASDDGEDVGLVDHFDDADA
jgi:hypothetical protein